MTAVDYDMRKHGEAVGWLVGGEPLIDRRRSATLPLHQLQISGIANDGRFGALRSILDRLFDDGLANLGTDDLSRLAHDLADLDSGIWHDAVSALEDLARGDCR